MNLRNRLIADILKYKYDKCSESELLIQKKELRCNPNREIYEIYDTEIRSLKEAEQLLIDHDRQFLYESFETEY